MSSAIFEKNTINRIEIIVIIEICTIYRQMMLNATIASHPSVRMNMTAKNPRDFEVRGYICNRLILQCLQKGRCRFR